MCWSNFRLKRSLYLLSLLSILVLGLSISFVSISNENNDLDNKEVALVVHNWQDRPISWFSLNGMMGGNAAAYEYNQHAYGAGKMTCCGVVKGNIALIKWKLGVKGSQYDKGMRSENYQLKVPLPDRKDTDDTLHVHFLPKNEIKLEWNNKNSSTFNPFDSNQ